MTTCDFSANRADPSSAQSLALVRAMEEEIDSLYAGRTGSIRDIGADPQEMLPPTGAYVIVWAEGEAVAGGGLKRLPDGSCEIKRMYVTPHMRGRGVAAVLLEALEQQARALGYTLARLDTGDRQPAAKRLYEGAGYREIADYNGNRVARHWYEKEL